MSFAEILHRISEKYWKRRLQSQLNIPVKPFLLPDIDWDRIRNLGSDIGPSKANEDLGSLEIFGYPAPKINESFKWNSFFDGTDTSKVTSFKIKYRNQQDIMKDIRLSWELNRLTWLIRSSIWNPNSRTNLSVFRDFLQTDKPGFGIRWNSMIELAMQSLALILLASLFEKKMNQSDLTLLNQALSYRLYFLQRLPSLYSSANNHRIAELVALFSLSESVRDTKLSRKYLKELESQLISQINSDGLNGELTSDYHVYVLDLLVTLKFLWKESLEKSSIDHYIESMCRAAVILKEGFQVWPSFSDSDDATLLSSIVGKNDRTLFLTKLAEISITDLDIDQTRFVHTFKDSGFTVAKWQTTNTTCSILIDHGKIGYGRIAAHGHADVLSVWLCYKSQPILVEAGTYSYHSNGDIRDTLRLGSMHNTISVDKESLSKPLGPFLWNPLQCATGRLDSVKSEKHLMTFSVSAEFGTRKQGKRRQAERVIKFGERELFVLDQAEKANQISSNFIISPIFQQISHLSMDRKKFEFYSEDLGSFEISCMDNCTLSVDRVQISPSYGKLEDAYRVTISGTDKNMTKINLEKLN